MSKGSGMGRKRMGERMNKGMDTCDARSHSKQCGRQKSVSKGNKKWMSEGPEVNPFHAEIRSPNPDD